MVGFWKYCMHAFFCVAVLTYLWQSDYWYRYTFSFVFVWMKLSWTTAIYFQHIRRNPLTSLHRTANDRRAGGIYQRNIYDENGGASSQCGGTARLLYHQATVAHDNGIRRMRWPGTFSGLYCKWNASIYSTPAFYLQSMCIMLQVLLTHSERHFSLDSRV